MALEVQLWKALLLLIFHWPKPVKLEADGRGKYISSTEKGTKSHMQRVRVNDATIGSEGNNREQN